ncbi:MAG: c-type cytochrome [Saprospiraceae bacterium]|nr:c-type cytochrome [Saprospiraceae bacterium]
MSNHHVSLRNLLGAGLLGALAVVGTIGSGCNNKVHGFVLPEGEALLGEMVFIDMHCNQCHSIADIDWAGSEENGDVHVKLGGEVTRIKSYGQLLTSVVHPSHKIASGYKDIGVNRFGQSKMKNYNDIMSVQQLIDLVTYLQDQYELKTTSHKYYPAW